MEELTTSIARNDPISAATIAKKGTERATTKVEVTSIVLNNIDTPRDLILAVGMSSSRLITIGVIVKAYLVIGVMT
jgi:hypothetical protein